MVGGPATAVLLLVRLWVVPWTFSFALTRQVYNLRARQNFFRRPSATLFKQRVRALCSTHDGIREDIPSVGDVDPNAAFAELLQSQLEIITTSTTASFAAIYISGARVVSFPADADWGTETLEPTLKPGEARFPVAYSGRSFGVLQTYGGGAVCPVAAVAPAVAKSIGLSIAVEMARQGTLEKFDRAMQDIVAIESDAWLRASSALLTARTLLQMVALRLLPDDNVGREMIGNVLDQTESVSEALVLLSHEGGREVDVVVDDDDGDDDDGDDDDDDDDNDNDNHHGVGMYRNRDSSVVYDVVSDDPGKMESSPSFFRQRSVVQKQTYKDGSSDSTSSVWVVTKDEVDFDWSDDASPAASDA